MSIYESPQHWGCHDKSIWALLFTFVDKDVHTLLMCLAVNSYCFYRCSFRGRPPNVPTPMGYLGGTNRSNYVYILMMSSRFFWIDLYLLKFCFNCLSTRPYQPAAMAVTSPWLALKLLQIRFCCCCILVVKTSHLYKPETVWKSLCLLNWCKLLSGLIELNVPSQCHVLQWRQAGSCWASASGTTTCAASTNSVRCQV